MAKADLTTGECCGKCNGAHRASSVQNRRSFVSWILGGGVAASLASFLYPVIRYLNPPQVVEAAINEVAGGKVQDLKPNSGKIVKFGNKPALLIHTADNQWKAFSAVCTHLNCTVQYRESTSQIWCACHNGTYDLSGNVVSGPPPKGLEEYSVSLRGDEVMISRHI
jgi:Rieske Fe-S protein